MLKKIILLTISFVGLISIDIYSDQTSSNSITDERDYAALSVKEIINNIKQEMRNHPITTATILTYFAIAGGILYKTGRPDMSACYAMSFLLSTFAIKCFKKAYKHKSVGFILGGLSFLSTGIIAACTPTTLPCKELLC